MKNKKVFFFIGYLTLLVIIGILPLFIPISIMDYSKEDWNGKDLADGIKGDDEYYNSTYLDLSQPTHLKVYDLRYKSYKQQIALTTLQGLVNRDNVSLFLIFRNSDEFWLEQLNESHGINYTMLDDDSYWNLFKQYNTSIDSLIIYDEDFLHTVNVATYMAGIYNCVVIHEDMVNNFSSIAGINTIKYDFRDKYSDVVKLYSWAWDKYGKSATKKMVCSYNPEQTAFRDYIVAAKIFTFHLAGGPMGSQDEIALLKEILDEYPDNIPVIGWFTDPSGDLGELESVKIVSKKEKYSLAATIPDFTVLVR